MNLYENHIKRNITIIRQNEKYPILCKSGGKKKNIRKKLKNQYSQSFEIYIKRERANCKYLIIRMNLKKKENV